MKQMLLSLTILFFSLLSQAEELKVSDDYVIGVGDTLLIKVFRADDLETTAKISGSGMLTFPLLGDIKVDGLSVSDVQKTIKNQLIEKSLILDPQVIVLVTDYQSKTFTVIGEFNKTGKFPLDRKLHLSDVLAMAAGTTENASDILTLVSEKDGQKVVTDYNLKTLFRNNLPEEDPEIKNKDIIQIPKYPVFFIQGYVNTPGKYKLTKNMRVSQALAASGGKTKFGSFKRIEIERIDAEGHMTKHEVTLDDLVQPDDVLYLR